ncbi:hypothetical protein [Streptomyces sp. 4R-3d]|uniref:hypothetical protein n=1 Tax=Streptomyces sp. 4R-3d TaxID=2559605 RepID=UPI0010721CC9|nr:hypothetical protein [Streptomyces sp. 4R-3d]TFI30153.1 hypothetical protein E4P36_05225 [Streptomyces sp. 4R-3d]
MIQPGQTYRSADPRGGPRIKVVGEPISVAGLHNSGKVDVVTLTKDGREIRRRPIEVTQLHATATTRDGTPRRTGYVLEQQ